MNAVILVIAAFSLLLPIEDPPAALALRGVTLEGTVIRTDTMLPVSGALLTFVDAATGDTLASAQSDNAGAYSTFVSTAVSDHPAVPQGLSVGAPYPNPVSDVRHIRVETGSFLPDDARIELFDIQGKRVQPGSHLAAGTYLLDVSLPSRKVRHTRSLTLLQPGPIELEAVPMVASDESAERFISAGKRSYGPILLAHLEAAGLVPHVQQIDLSIGIYRVDFELSPSHANVALGPDVKIIDVPLNVETSSQQVDIQWAGSPVDGLQLAFPEQAFEGNWTLALSYREVLDHQLDSRFRAISPAISIDTNHHYADHAFRVSVPVSVSADHSALAVLYDQESGRMEVLPPSNGPEGTVSFEARHLYRMPDITASGKSAEIRLEYPGEVIVFEISQADLYGNVRYDTGFTSGVDNWEFVNHGSILSPGGICAGQSLTNIWYFLETYRPNLYGSLLDEDLQGIRFEHSNRTELSPNEQGYRMASIAQEEHNLNTALYEYAIRERSAEEDRQTFEAFAAAMLLTGEPQMVGLFRSQLGGGHAIVAYAVDLVDFRLYVNDPNFPTQERFIQWTEAGFQPYSSKQKADDPDERAFDRISFLARSALTDWPSLGTLWNDVWHERAGSTERYTWPEYELQQLVHDEWIPVDGTLYGDREEASIRAVCPDCHDMGLHLAQSDSSPDWLGFSLFNSQGGRILENADCPSNSNCFLDTYTEVTLPATPEVRHVGLWGLVLEENTPPSPTWVGFQTLEVAAPV